MSWALPGAVFSPCGLGNPSAPVSAEWAVLPGLRTRPPRFRVPSRRCGRCCLGCARVPRVSGLAGATVWGYVDPLGKDPGGGDPRGIYIRWTQHGISLAHTQLPPEVLPAVWVTRRLPLCADTLRCNHPCEVGGASQPSSPEDCRARAVERPWVAVRLRPCLGKAVARPWPQAVPHVGTQTAGQCTVAREAHGELSGRARRRGGQAHEVACQTSRRRRLATPLWPSSITGSTLSPPVPRCVSSSARCCGFSPIGAPTHCHRQSERSPSSGPR